MKRLFLRNGLICNLLPVLLFAVVAAQAADVSFYGVFKAQKYNQVSSGAPSLGTGNPYRFDAVVSPSMAGTVTNATVSPPGSASQLLTFDVINQWLSFEAKFSSQAALDSAAPSGNYTLLMDTLNQGKKTETLNLSAETFPTAPHISNWTAGQAIDPTLDFKLMWDRFPGGTTNDYILVLMGDQASGAINFRSPSPFRPGALNGTNTFVMIPATNLQPSTVYVLEIMFVKMHSTDTTSYPGARGIVGFNAFTDTGLTTINPIQLSLSFRSFALAGSFFAGTNATPGFPVTLGAYRTELTVTGTTNFVAPAQVLVTGPPGSGLTNTPCAIFNQSGNTGFFFSPKISAPAVAPPGTWSATYAGIPYNFPEPGLQSAANLVVPVPTVGTSAGTLQNVTWTYYDPLGNPISGTPALVTSVQVQAFDPVGTLIYNSPALTAATTAYSFTNVVYWTNVDALRFVYSDTANDLYLITYANIPNPAPAQLSALSLFANEVAFQLTGQIGQRYTVQFSSDLSKWTDLLTTNLSTAMLPILDSQSGGASPRFYRTRIAP